MASGSWTTLLLIVFFVFIATLAMGEARAAQRKSSNPIVRRITRQSGRYGVGSSSNNNYQGAYAVRGGIGVGGPGPGSAGVGSIVGGGGSVGPLSSGSVVYKSAASRPVGVGAFSFGGAASGRPSYGPTFAINSSGSGGRPAFGPHAGGGGASGGRPQQGSVYRGAAGRPGQSVYQG